MTSIKDLNVRPEFNNWFSCSYGNKQVSEKKQLRTSKRLTAWSGVVPIKAKSCPSSTLYVGLSRLSSMARDCSRVNELLRWLVGWCRLLMVKQVNNNKFVNSSPGHLHDYRALSLYKNRQIPLGCMCKLQVLVGNHLQVRRCRHAAQEDWLLHHGDDCLGVWHRLRGWHKKTPKN